MEDILAKPRRDQETRRAKRAPDELVAGQIAISERCAALPVLDAHTPEEIIGYNDQGVFD